MKKIGACDPLGCSLPLYDDARALGGIDNPGAEDDAAFSNLSDQRAIAAGTSRIEPARARIAISSDPMGLGDDCARAFLVVALYPVPRGAKEGCAVPLIDRAMAWDHGAHAIWVSKHGEVTIRSVEAARGLRPWSQKGSQYRSQNGAQNVSQDGARDGAAG